ncbi:MAG: glycerophosphodiester phosphodiesterase [Lentisphaerae bacterium]|jgi:glycerophosphoryl diester phosphodiesterase|nr:glycerophosphodiester phosphodiesterase [Lentisphaerota bacterium]MBT4815509.1 glycerophosphodiester phosphodiesterase [Lentisphaerota bacterium]MBT5606489.1 glycerophosphodiester phosphodiesterase [Lentisphaerota bacterium]MBT7058851.1 glycerophosphodiester phosphodiesterase [Lentisphaerota bacterium]MBT7846488.1 glycerophosphodiester phosphodiesterase [Lentisphaerota bacterium]
MSDFLNNGITAHRGNAGQFPENTIPAFRSGIACGADWLELDAHRTVDGQLVVCHDATTGATADRNLCIATSTWDELRTLDMSCGFRQKNEQSSSTCPTTGMPSLRDVLELVLTQSRTRVSIQPKADCVPEIAALIHELHAGPWIGFNDGDVQTLLSAHELIPEAWVFLDTGPAGPPVDVHIDVALQHGFRSIVMHHSLVTRQAANAISEAGLEPGAWTVNDTDHMSRALEAGITRMYTDYPARLKDVLKGKGRQ